MRQTCTRWLVATLMIGALNGLVLPGCGGDSGVGDADMNAETDGGTDGTVNPRDFHESVAMRDGVRLDTRVILPAAGAGPWPALLVRSPYLIGGSDVYVEYFGPFTNEGYALLVQSVRGTGDSEGTLDPLVQEFPDGEDTVAWLTDQPWSNGRVGTFGASYEGFTAGAAAVASPAVQVVVMDGAISRAFEGWPAQRGIGANYGMLVWWTWVHGEDAGQDPTFYDVITNLRPMRDNDVAYFGKEVDQWRALIPYLESSSAFWDERSLVGRIGQRCIPALHLQAAQEWADDPLAAFLDSQGAPCSAEERSAQRFVLGHHTHGWAVYDPFAQTPSSTLVRQYFATYLKDEQVGLQESPRIHYYLSGADSWQTAPTWPPSPASRTWYLATPDTLVDDVPTQGIATLSVDPAVDDPCDANYNKYLYFTSNPLDAAIDLVGRAEVSLTVAIDAPDTDLYAYLYEVTPQYSYELIHFSRMRLQFRNSYTAPEPMTPGIPTAVTIELPAVARRIPAGARIMLAVGGAECGTQENANTGGPSALEISTQPVVISVHGGGATPSRVRLPIVEPR